MFSHPTLKHRMIRPVLVALLALVTLVAACSNSDFADTAVEAASDSSLAPAAVELSANDAMDEAEAFEPAAERAGGDNAEFDGDGGATAGLTTTGAAGSEVTAQLPDLGRDIIFTATLEIASTDVSAATREAIRSIEARGGFLFAQETRGGSGGSSVLTFKVLPDQFQAALNDLGSVGEVRSQSISADDVSAIVVDLESRINTAEASVIRLRNLLDDASELETIATLENQLLQRETTLEQLRGQLRSIRSQVDLATITVVVTELLNRPGMSIEAMAYRGQDAGFGCFDASNGRAVEADEPITICYRLTNTGDAPLVDITIDDQALGASVGTLVIVDGAINQIDPGESVVLAQEIELSESVRVRTSVTATALDANGAEIDEPVQTTAPVMRFDVTGFDDGIPSFRDVLTDSLKALRTAALVIALVVVAVAPFAAVALVLGLPMWKLLQRRRRTHVAAPQAPAQPAPPAPAPPPPPAPDTPETEAADKAQTSEKDRNSDADSDPEAATKS